MNVHDRRSLRGDPSDEFSASLSQTRDILFVPNVGVKQAQIGANICNEGNRDVTRKVILADALFRFKCVNCRCPAVRVSINIDTTDCVDRGCGCGLERNACEKSATNKILGTCMITMNELESE
jgi:hypothetical protein